MMTLWIRKNDGQIIRGEYDSFQMCERLAEIDRLLEMQNRSNISEFGIDLE